MTDIKWIGDDGVIPHNKISIFEVTCYHCKRTTRMLRESVVDAEVTGWKDRYERLAASLVRKPEPALIHDLQALQDSIAATLHELQSKKT